MSEPATANEFFIWGVDLAAYGPVELPTLVEWIKDGRVLAETWVFTAGPAAGCVRRNPRLVKLKVFLERFRRRSSPRSFIRRHQARSLRRIKILASLNDAQLAHLAQFMELERVPQWKVVCEARRSRRRMYLIIDGELRARIMTDSKRRFSRRSGLAFFRDMALFDNGPRSRTWSPTRIAPR